MKIKYTENDLDIMARTLFGESAPGDIEDATLIASVIFTRIIKRQWPDTASAVCLQPWQFSCWNPGDPNRERIQRASGTWFDTCHKIAKESLEGLSPYKGLQLTHYYATYVKRPKWAKGKKSVIESTFPAGRHLFFNDIDTPAPITSRQALDQAKPMSSSRTMQGSAVAASTGLIATGVGVVAQVSPAVPVVKDVAETAQNNPTGLLIVFGLIVLAAAAYVLYARMSDRAKGIH